MDGRDIVCIMPTGLLLILGPWQLYLLRNDFQAAVNPSHTNYLRSSRQGVLWLSHHLFL